MKKNHNKPRILYKKFLEEHKDEFEKRKLEEELQADTVVVKKITTGAKLAQLSVDVLAELLKILGFIIILALLSLAVTVLINEPLREYVLEYLRIR